MRRSPELKKTLSEAIGTEDIVNAAAGAQYNSKYARDKEKRLSQVERQFDAEIENINALKERLKRLRADAEILEDEVFEQTFIELSSSIEATSQRITRYEEDADDGRRYVAEFIERGEIKTFENFLGKMPMFWMPRKADISRILSFAKLMHETATSRGEKSADEPIKIIDIGGSNGFLGTLVTEMARENGMHVEYVIADPDKKTVNLAAKAYEKNPDLKFRVAFAEEVANEAMKGDRELEGLLETKAWIKSEATPKLKDLELLKKAIHTKKKEGLIDQAAIEKFRGILKQDFGIVINTPTGDEESFMTALDGEWGKGGIYQTYFDRAQEQMGVAAKDIESHLLNRPSEYDLVINSWMPPGTDFTQDIRAVNGRAVLYITETWGATGVQQGSPYPREVKNLGGENSYGTGALYDSQLTWVGNSTPELSNLERGKKYRTPYRPHGTHDYANAFLFQTKKNYKLTPLDCAPEKAGIKTSGEYPWEKELNKRGKLSPVRRLKKDEDYHSTLSEIVEDLGGER